LQLDFRGLVILIREFVEPILELKVAQVFVDGGLPLFKVKERRDRLRLRKVLSYE